jgi:hypothetical protein
VPGGLPLRISPGPLIRPPAMTRIAPRCGVSLTEAGDSLTRTCLRPPGGSCAIFAAQRTCLTTSGGNPQYFPLTKADTTPSVRTPHHSSGSPASSASPASSLVSSGVGASIVSSAGLRRDNCAMTALDP